MQNIAKTCQNKKQNPVRTQFSAASDLNPLPSATEVADLEGDTSRRGLDDGWSNPNGDPNGSPGNRNTNGVVLWGKSDENLMKILR